MKTLDKSIKVAAIVAASLLITKPAFCEVKPKTDKQINEEVQSKIKEDKELSQLKINIQTKNGTTALSGTVNTNNEASKVIEIATSVPGVEDLDTANLNVKKSKHPFDDAVITAKVKSAFLKEKLFGEKDVAAMNIHVETVDGVVHLTGTIEEGKGNDAIRIARGIKGVRRVESHVRECEC